MDFIKNLSFTIALLLIGAAFILLGVLGKFQIGQNYTLGVENTWMRSSLVFVGVVFVGIAVGVEFKSRGIISNRTLATQNLDGKDNGKTGAEKFFFTLDDQMAGNFQTVTQGAQRISILSRTAVNLLGQYQKVFEHLGSSGCNIRFLFVDPTCDVARYVYGNAGQVYWNNINTASGHIKRLQAKIGAQLQVKTTKHAPTLSVIIVEKQPIGESFARVQLYFLHSCVGRDRPIFQTHFSDKWYNVFVEEFNQIWSASNDWDESCLVRSDVIEKLTK